MPYKLFSYERRLGIRELESLGVTTLVDEVDSIVGIGDPVVAERLTYFGSVLGVDGEEPTEQAAVELGHLQTRAAPGRQATRYGLHGIHEYKGKFNPQIVRALCNVVDPEAETLIDPFCGSGTALVEGLRLGMDVVGIDQSPIASLIAKAKLGATTAKSAGALADDLLSLADRTAEAMAAAQAGTGDGHQVTDLGPEAEEYLRRWFTPPAYRGLIAALAILNREEKTPSGQLGRVALSSILRQVSLQLPEDLRIRRRPEPFTAPLMAPLFLESIERIRRGLLEIGSWQEITSSWTLRHGSAEELDAYAAARGGKRRLILTSPPYATALPYIDTDRLSVVALGLAGSGELNAVERSLIGSREWARPQQHEWDERRKENSDRLPPEVVALTTDIEERNEESGAGFRRQAVPSLLYRYFARMGTALDRWRAVLEEGESAVLIVGHNHTNAGGERVEIPTPLLLAEIAAERGFVVRETIKLETWPRYGLHAANGVPGEDAVVLER
ncbi:MAG TPA: hypothetical protein VFM94_09460 [Solirubrobacterales bacterium]|nr:hypothetical protein [Solirubrobacterales bacterium]